MRYTKRLTFEEAAMLKKEGVQNRNDDMRQIRAKRYYGKNKKREREQKITSNIYVVEFFIRMTRPKLEGGKRL